MYILQKYIHERGMIPKTAKLFLNLPMPKGRGF
jgi:hypothetical protein